MVQKEEEPVLKEVTRIDKVNGPFAVDMRPFGNAFMCTKDVLR
jgi:hypothetical protein